MTCPRDALPRDLLLLSTVHVSHTDRGPLHAQHLDLLMFPLLGAPVLHKTGHFESQCMCIISIRRLVYIAVIGVCADGQLGNSSLMKVRLGFHHKLHLFDLYAAFTAKAIIVAVVLQALHDVPVACAIREHVPRLLHGLQTATWGHQRSHLAELTDPTDDAAAEVAAAADR